MWFLIALKLTIDYSFLTSLFLLITLFILYQHIQLLEYLYLGGTKEKHQGGFEREYIFVLMFQFNCGLKALNCLRYSKYSLGTLAFTKF